MVKITFAGKDLLHKRSILTMSHLRQKYKTTKFAVGVRKNAVPNFCDFKPNCETALLLCAYPMVL